jgi:hypothetical protein
MLRLVSTRVAPTPHVSPDGIAPSDAQHRLNSEIHNITAANAQLLRARRVARENAAASDLSVDDARWIFSQETARRLEGDRQAILRPQRRRDLHALATQAGLRPFDANLVIAIVQDAARNETGPLSPAVSSRLSLVRTPQPQARSVLAQMITATLLGLIGTATLIAWFVSSPPR